MGFPDEVRAVYLDGGLSERDGLATHARAGHVLVDMSTSQPALAVAIAEAASARGALAIDAPVSGGDIGAREARLSIMVGGDEAAVAALEPAWTAMGKTWVRQGGPGAGQHTKMTNQILIASGMIGVCEALLYAHRAGLPGFFVEHFIKDMAIALDEARRLGLALPGLALAQQLYQSVRALGYGKKGTHALQLALAAMSGVDWSKR